MLKMYYKMLYGFNGNKEQIGTCYSATFENADKCKHAGTLMFAKTKTPKLEDRRWNETYFYGFLSNQLFHRLLEMKFYSEVDINTTRRLVAVSPDCISTIQILIRDKIYVNVYFRSSDWDGALPADLEFISTIPNELINHLKLFKSKKGYEEVSDNLIHKYMNKEVQINIMFGSLHRGNNDILT